MAIAFGDATVTGFNTNVTSVNVGYSGSLAVGNLMIAFMHLSGGAAGRTWDDISGWTLIGEVTDTSGDDTATQVMYRVATLGDIGGSATFTISGGTAQRAAAAILRFTGQNQNQSIDLFTTGQTVGNDDTPAFTGVGASTYANSMYVILVAHDEGAGSSGVSNYAIQTDNIVWTERFDNTYSGVGPGGFAAATGLRTTTLATGDFSVTIDGATGNLTESFGFIIVIRPIQDVTFTATEVTGAATVPTPAITTGVTLTADTVTAVATAQTAAPKMLTEWINEDKNSVPSWVNEDKTS